MLISPYSCTIFGGVLRSKRTCSFQTDCASGMLYFLMSMVVVTVMHVLSILSLVLVPVASEEGTVSSQLVVARNV